MAYSAIALLSDAEKQGVYDETGATAIDGLKNSIDEIRPFVSDAFRAKFSREIETVSSNVPPHEFFPETV